MSRKRLGAQTIRNPVRRFRANYPGRSSAPFRIQSRIESATKGNQHDPVAYSDNWFDLLSDIHFPDRDSAVRCAEYQPSFAPADNHASVPWSLRTRDYSGWGSR